MPAPIKSSTPRSAPRARPYHHGDLRSALLQAAERVLQRDGAEQLTLRAVAREADVSHTAPQHHFGDLTGVLSTLAGVGYGRFRDTMLESVEGVADPRVRAQALGRSYLRFAAENREMFLLMFRSARIDMRHPALRDAADAAFAVLAGERGVATPGGMSIAQASRVTAAWAFVHGLAFLVLDGRLTGIVRSLPDGTTEADLLAATVGGMLGQLGAPADV